MPENWLPGLARPDVQAFMHAHQAEDPFELSLKHREVAGIEFRVIAQQLSARKKARSKLPEWYETPGIVFPPSENLEQSSSEATARYKSHFFTGDSLADLTGGTGIDTYYLSKGFGKTIYVEQNQPLTELARHNFKVLQQPIQVITSDAQSFLSENNPLSHYFIDPSRRSANQHRVYNVHDCSPDITEIIKLLPPKAKLLIKLSPMLDIRQTCLDLHQRVEEVHIVSYRNEVKELLFLYGSPISDPEIIAVDIAKNGSYQIFNFQPAEEARAQVPMGPCQQYLYEANAAVRKSGAFKLVAQRHGLTKLGLHTHLYSSNDVSPDFPGRIFRIEWCMPYQPGKLRKLKLKKANIQSRNFPDDVEQIRKKTNLKDGGNHYLFFYRDFEDRLFVAGGPKAV